MSEETNEGKIIIFNPSGFILKLIFSIVMTVLMAKSMDSSLRESTGLLYKIFSYAVSFVMCWFIASMFGFCLRATANYIIAFILMFILIALLSAGMTWLGQNYRTLGDIAGVIFIILLIWLPINDIRKAILYFKNTI